MKVLLLTLVSLLALSPVPIANINTSALSTPPEISQNMSLAAQGSEQDAVHAEAEDTQRLSGKSVVTYSKPRYISTTTIKPRSGKSSGATLGSASKGYAVWGTGKTSAGHTQIKFFGQDAWVKSSSVKRVSVANYTTKRGTALRAGAAAGKTLAKLPTDYTVGTLNNARTNKNQWVQVQYAGKTGWVASKDIRSVSLDATAGPGPKSYSDATWASMVRKNIAKYCPSVDVRVSKKRGEYYAESIPRRITLSRIGNNDPNAGNIKAVALHECAHMQQFKVYPSGFAKLTKYAEKINPRLDGRGIEHLADCMSERMGAKRTGTLANGSTYIAGYQGKCTSAQNQAAASLLAGKRPAGA